jgi:hypothetical protein
MFSQALLRVAAFITEAVQNILLLVADLVLDALVGLALTLNIIHMTAI